ncbi:MAG: hypothetical protein KF715_08630 [Candidatus Didemnitutus sp.]|nr:hypothetical protein [Candidatus Didemnitutus sp.]
MSGVGILIQRDDISPLLARLRDAAQSRGLTLVMGRAVANQVKDHLVALNAERHRYGNNYYARAARSVSVRAAAGFALISIAYVGIRQRYYGGEITPKTAKYLTIPVAPEAYGMRAREFADLKFALMPDPKTGELRPALVRRASTAISFTRRRGKDGVVRYQVQRGDFRNGGQVMFWLVKRVRQKPDPSVLPTRTEMIDTALQAGRRRLERLAGRAQEDSSS